ncbi:response regulator [bacterium]|nr:response regulator [bacterium]
MKWMPVMNQESENCFPIAIKGRGNQEMIEKKILIAEDEELVASIAQTMLKHLGYGVIIAGNGKEAYEMFQKYQEEISMIILDYNMPEMDGLDCLDAIREQSSIPALITTGAGLQFNEEEIKNHKAQGFINKPYTMDEIKSKIEELIK